MRKITDLVDGSCWHLPDPGTLENATLLLHSKNLQCKNRHQLYTCWALILGLDHDATIKNQMQVCLEYYLSFGIQDECSNSNLV